MRQKIRKIEEIEKIQKIKSINDLSSDINKPFQENYYEKKFNLVDSFGTIKAKKQMASVKTAMRKEDYSHNIDDVAKFIQENKNIDEADESTAKGKNRIIYIEEKKREQLEKLCVILPKFNEKSTDPKQIYDLTSSNNISDYKKVIDEGTFETINHKPLLKTLKKDELFEQNKKKY